MQVRDLAGGGKGPKARADHSSRAMVISTMAKDVVEVLPHGRELLVEVARDGVRVALSLLASEVLV